MNRVLQTIYSILVWILITLVTLSISTLMIIASFALHFFDPDPSRKGPEIRDSPGSKF